VQEALRLNSAYFRAVDVLFSLAWLRATSADDEIYDPPKALAIVHQGMETVSTRTGKKTDPMVLRVLAAVQAANGHFSEATETARQAVESAISLGRRKMTRKILKEMELYKKNTPNRKSGSQGMIEDMYEN